MFGIKRREFITLLGGAIASWPRTGRAQQRPKIGLLDTGLGTAFAVPFMGKLAELGYVDGENVVIERRSADGNPRAPGGSRCRPGAPESRCDCDGRHAGRVCRQESYQHNPYRSWRQQ